MLRDLARRTMYSLGLEGLAYRMRAHWRGDEPGPETDENGVALPPRDMINRVVGDLSAEAFLRTGRQTMEVFRDAVERQGGDFAGAGRILDFGCGCGRLARHLPDLSRAAVTGCDLNGALVEWCRTHLKGDFFSNSLTPPLDLDDGAVDILYALSVFTHLREETQTAWLSEFRRVLAPGGFALVSFHDEDDDGLAREGLSREELVAQGFILRHDAAEGSNYIAAFQSRAHATALFGGALDVCEIIASGETGFGQALAVLRKNEDSA